MTLKKGADDGAYGGAPPSPRIPSKRAKVNPDQVVPDPGTTLYPTPTPPLFIRKMRNAAVGTGCDIRLKVAVAGDPQPSLYWYHNDDLLNMDNQEYGGLWIRDCKPSDAGLYTCIANNYLGEARTSAVLAVLDLGEDSETTEDEAVEPQIPLETKDQDSQRVPTGKTSLHFLCIFIYIFRDWIVVTAITSKRYTSIRRGQNITTFPGEFEEKLKQPKSSGMSQSSTQESRPQTPISEYSRKDLTPRPSPKLTRASSKIFEKVRVFEERRRSIDNPEGSISGRSWAGFNRAPSIESDEGGSHLGISRESSREDLREALKADAAQRRSVFRQRAASLEDKPRYSQKVQDIENKFAEELQRIKKLVGKPHMKKSFSTEQLTHRSRQPFRKLEPIPPQVLQKLQDRERAQQSQEHREKERSPPKAPQTIQSQSALTQPNPLETKKSPVTSITVSRLGEEVTSPEAMSPLELPGQYSARHRQNAKSSDDSYVSAGEDPMEAPVFEFPLQDTIASAGSEVLLKCIIAVPPVEPGLAIIKPVKDMVVQAGESALFECQVSGPQDVDVDWLSDGKLIQPALLNCKMHYDGKRCRLLLNSVHEDDSGTYTCKLSTAKEELTSSAKLKVIPSVEPLFTRKLDVLEVIEGRNARFDCKVSGTPPPKVTWSHFDHPLMESEDIHILKEGGRHSLVISHVCNEDEGFYMVVAQNMHGEAECSAELYVQEPRPAISSQMAKLEKMPSIPEEPEVPENEMERFTMPDFVKPLYDMDVIEGREAILKCKVAGLPYPTIAWFHNGKRIDSTEDRKMTQFRDIHSLVIRSVCHAHGGVYKSVISNKVGKATCYSHLYVTDVLPDPPNAAPVIESITGKTITLRWNKPKRLDPSIDPSSLMYAIQQQALGSIQWTIIASCLKETSYTITSLSKGVRYAFRILSITNKAFSKPSPATDPVQLLDRGPYLKEAPVITDKPDIVYMVENQSVSITITLNHVNASVTWKRKGVTLPNKPGVYEMSMPDDDQHNMKIVKAKNIDVGQLLCVAGNQYGSDSCNLTLDLAAPPTFETIMEDLDVTVGETPRFAVIVEGKPVPDILWYKNDTLLSESSHFTFVYDDNECSLVVLNTRPEDCGVYTCTAKNLAGAVSCKAELSVHTAKEEGDVPMEDEESILRKMRRLTDYYDVHKEIGRGAFSYVKRVTQKAVKTEYAAKFISAHAKRKALALREINLLSQLDHERIMYFHDAFEKKNGIIIITELCHEELLERMAKKSTVTESDIRSSMRQLLEGIGYLHDHSILHLDIKPDNILMADSTSDQIRICDFGNAVKIMPDEAQYCKYGTPEFVAPEIVNQTPVSKATDIWPIGVISYLCLTGVSPFAGENDRSTVLNIRNYNVAFEESMFADLCHEAKGFVIKLLVADRLRPDAIECLRHPWFKILNKGKSISTEFLKKVLSRRKWQRSLISYKSKMVMRSIPELLNDSSSHISIAVPRHMKEGSPPPSSSSDSDEDIDELPFIPMPLNMDFSASRMSLTDITGEDEAMSRANGTTESSRSAGHGQEPMELEHAKRPLRRGSSMDSDKSEGPSRRRGELRRGSSADSALLLHITPEEGAGDEGTDDGRRIIKKAVSMELPRRSTSPGAGKLGQEDYALKLELMRQRLLRGGSVDNKMSGLRGPLLETLGMGDEKRFGRAPRLGVPPLTRAASSESPRDDIPKTKVLRKSASFSQGDTEPMPLHRRLGAPLEIPLAQIEERRLQEAVSMSALAEPPKQTSRPVTPKLTTPDEKKQDATAKKGDDVSEEKESKVADIDIKVVCPESKDDQESAETGVLEKDRIVLPDGRTSAYASIMQTIMVPSVQVASTEYPPKEPSPPKASPRTSPMRESVPASNLKDIASEEVFEARFKKRESSLTRGLKLLSWQKEEKPVAVASEEVEEVYRPGHTGSPLEFVQRRLEEKSKSVQDLREAQKDQGFMRRLSLRLRRTPSEERTDEKSKEDETPRRRLSWALGRRGSQDKKEVEMIRLDGGADIGEPESSKKSEESPVLAMRKKIGSTVAGISMRIRSYSEERREEKKAKEEEAKETKRTPLFSMLRRSTSEGGGLRRNNVPQNQLASQSAAGASTESLESMSSIQSETASMESDRRSRWDRWGLTRGRRDKTASQPDIPTAIARENDFPPVFHIKLRDHVLLEGDPVTLSCLPAGSPHPHIQWTKDKKPLEIDARMNMISCPDGRQLLMIMKTTKRDAGVYECVATNPLATVTSSCTISLARLPNRPGTPEVPQKYRNTALVVWRPSDTLAPCTYSLERRTEGESNWLMVATGIADCYCNVTDLPAGGNFRFRVACVNKAGQGPYSNLSDIVNLDTAAPAQSSKPTLSAPAPAVSAQAAVPAPVPAHSALSHRSVSEMPPPAPGTPTTAKAKTTLNITMAKPTPSAPQTQVPSVTKSSPPVILPKPQSPINVVSPMAKSRSVSPPPLLSPPPAIGKPISSVPMYIPSTTTGAQVTSTTPSPALAPPVVLVTSLSPVGEGTATPCHMTPSGQVTLSGRKPGESTLRQGVPQKPYTFMDEKARGRFGVIRECRENATGNLFMAKIVPYEPENKQTVLQEYDILKSLHHDKIMALHEAYVTPRYLVLIAEFCAGKEILYSLTDRFRYSEDDVVGYVVQILQGLDYLHNRRILHLDLKTDNIIVTYMNVVKIIDFGSAQTFNPLFLKQFSPPIGTMEYMSPEMLKGDVVGPPADIWSVGVLTYIMLSGRSPFTENDPAETEARIQAAKFDLSKLYQNVSQSASLFLKKILCSYPWARPSIKDCFNNSWLQDAYLMRLRRQTLTFTTNRLKEFLGQQQLHRAEVATKHKVLLRSYQSTPQTPTSPTSPASPSTPVTSVGQ
uniref:non-specific serine/threonine protein kinase n=1 Tax=Denticeps clupeoides TaxID=299321 RepID=A0AAY4BJR1_9TELE